MKIVEGGLVIAFDGPDGVGKSTQVKETANYLHSLGYNVHTTSFSGGTPIGVQLRGVSLSSTERVAETDLHISLAMGYDLAADLQKRRLAGQICLIDRSPLTMAAYNVYASQLKNEEYGLVAMDSMIEEWRLDSILYFNAPPEVAQKRLKARTSKSSDYFEDKDAGYRNRIREGYQKAFERARQHPRLTLHKINANGTIEAIQKNIRSILPIEER